MTNTWTVYSRNTFAIFQTPGKTILAEAALPTLPGAAPGTGPGSTRLQAAVVTVLENFIFLATLKNGNIDSIENGPVDIQGYPFDFTHRA